MDTRVEAGPPPDANHDPQPRFGLADRAALREIFRLLCFLALYLMFVQIVGTLFKPGRLVSALAQFIPYCLVLVAVVYRGRSLLRFDKQTLLMASCLAAVFVIFLFDVTKNLTWFVGFPILGGDSRVRNDLATLAIMVAIASFPAASFFLIDEILQAKRQLDEQVLKLQDALNHVKRLQGLLPICMYCHKIRTDQQSWQRIELYIMEHSEANFTHSLCPACAQEHYPELNLYAGTQPGSSPPSRSCLMKPIPGLSAALAPRFPDTPAASGCDTSGTPG